jgi:hypothetical protein
MDSAAEIRDKAVAIVYAPPSKEGEKKKRKTKCYKKNAGVKRGLTRAPRL